MDSDATLILNLGELEGGTLATLRFAEKLDRPHLLLPLDQGVGETELRRVREWLQKQQVVILNVAGPRESKRPGIYRLTRELLEKLL
jgi:EAL domain-containing protein (putative c-di-GMP-specific phosphodiesterase class I)